ncbi:GGDEF domain-containing protein [Enterovirga aerilata]|uniref:diguanylate cyclase n=1 Tax=Enterovirga aerilata TaxID=2730920 RepID=A0A849I5E0_9HYPH|nr:diguanylate cyclase [Enterovirga sp. DB1703]NNM74672.1 diguanylate cyclase [Enterovirga sp. DB1703]
MLLDLWTLIFVTILVTAVLGVLLLFSWRQNRRIEALCWWGAALLLGAVGGALLVGRTVIPDILSIVAANAVLFVSYGFMWTGCRRFAGRTARTLAMLAGAVAWVAACAFPPFYESFTARVALSSALISVYILACIREMWDLAGERLASRGPLVCVLVLHAGAMLSRPLLLWLFDAQREATLFSFPWLTLHAFETLVFTILSAFLFLALSKEKVEGELRIMASRDPLTGVLNRRAFLEQAERRVTAAPPGSEAVLLLLDIDHFKRINDSHGHAVGDDVLRSFCRLACERLPAGALFARLGGEEFGCLLPRTSLVDGYYAAEYLRNALALRPLGADSDRLRVTVSVGLATTAACGRELQGLMSSADRALYEAKHAGRNRVVCSPGPPALAA